MPRSEAYHPSVKNWLNLTRLSGWFRQVSPGVIPVLIVLLALAARLAPGARTIDDAYITFRYARNILSGAGFVYNTGERVLGTTTPLYTLLLSGIGVLLGGKEANFPQIALGINTLADCGVCLLLYFCGKRFGFPLAGTGAALAWAVAPYSVTFAIGGLETSVYVLLLTATAFALIAEKGLLAAFLAALMLLTRPDALIFIGFLFLERLRNLYSSMRKSGGSGKENPSHPSLYREILAFVLPCAAWFSFAWRYFGSPLPHSVTAKTLAYRLEPLSALARLLQHFATPFMDNLTFGEQGMLVGLVFYLFLFLLGGYSALRKNAGSWPFFVYPLAYFATFAAANPLIFRWYLTPPLPAYILGILIGGEQLLGASTRSLPARWRKLGYLLIILAPLGLSLNAWTWQADHAAPRPAPQMAWIQLELLYRQAADSLQPDIASHPGGKGVLAAGDVGVLGYFTTAEILDTVGLNSPTSTKYYPTRPEYYLINYAIPPELILDNQPDYLVMLEIYGRSGLLKDPRFWQDYRLRQKIPTDIYGSDGMLIFERKSGK